MSAATPDLIATAFAAVTGEAVLEVVRLEGNASLPSWRVTTARQRAAVRLYPQTNGLLEASFAAQQVALLEFLREQGFPVARVVAFGLYRGKPLLAQSWLGEMTVAEALQRHPEKMATLGEAFGALHASLHTLPTQGLTGMAQLQTLPGGKVALLHLDYHPLNVLVGGESTIGVIDWDNACLGDPRADVARTLSLLSINPDLRALPREARCALRALRRAYLRGYEVAAGKAALAGLSPFLASAGRYMLADLERRHDGAALASIGRWTARWART